MTCGEAESGAEALEGIKAVRPDLAVVDLSLKGSDGVELIKAMRIQCPKVRVLVLSMYDESLYAERAARAGADGYITKQEATQKIMTAILQILNGGVYRSQPSVKVSNGTLPPRSIDKSPLGVLSDRELEVFRRIGHGQGTREISEALHLGVKTVESYRSRIKKKLRLSSGTNLAHHAVQWVQSRNEL
jgi:DNA-binding NarL/FixJ family response regulator